MKRFELKFRQDKAGSESSGTLEEVFVPAFLNHVTELAMSLQSGHSSAVVNIDNVDDNNVGDGSNNGCGDEDVVNGANADGNETEEEKANLADDNDDQDHLEVPNVSVSVIICSLY